MRKGWGQKMRALQGKRGFTLVEAMVAACVLAIAVLSASFSLFNLQNLSEFSRQKVVAVADANRILEAMREQANASLTNTKNADWSTWFQTNVLNARGTNEIQLDQENIAAVFSGTDPLQITLTLNWNQRGRPQAYQVITLMTSRG